MFDDAEILRALITVLYPIPSEIPVAHDRVLFLLAAPQRYDMPAVQSFIRSELRRTMPATRTGGEAFRAYAIANRDRLLPKTCATAYLTLDYPLTFESLGANHAYLKAARWRPCQISEVTARRRRLMLQVVS